VNARTVIRATLVLAGAFWSAVSFAADAPLTAELVSVAKIWDAGKHNAFTDLVRHNEAWFCVFREGEGHVSDDGKLRVITSKDGKEWTSIAVISSSDGDLRDAKISVTPAGKLMLSTVLATPKNVDIKHQSRTYFSDDGQTWDGPHTVGDPNFWLWRTSWHDGKAYNVGYATHGENQVRLYVSDDGKKFSTLVQKLAVKNEYPNESALGWKDDGTALCLLRCEKPNLAQLGTAAPPYKEWTWRELDQPLGGPALIRHESGRWLAAGRIHKPTIHTGLCWLDTDNGKLVELAKVPSDGDTSYPGLVWHDELLWMSYYSSHEGKTSIYLAKLRVQPAK
jgi:hypothetical protein